MSSKVIVMFTLFVGRIFAECIDRICNECADDGITCKSCTNDFFLDFAQNRLKDEVPPYENVCIGECRPRYYPDITTGNSIVYKCYRIISYYQ